jgi:hypothetical protein
VYSTAVFLFIQRNIVITLQGLSTRRFMPVYSKPLTLAKGVDNQLQFQFLNQDQKPVDVTNLEITFRAIDQTGSTILFQQSLDPVFPANGIMQLNLAASTLVPVNAQACFYTLSIPSPDGSNNYPVYVNQDAASRGDLNIVNSTLPSVVPSLSVSIPTAQGFPNIRNYTTDIYTDLNNITTFYSSVITNDNNPIITLQTQYYEFTGNVTIEGSCSGNGEWAPITNYAYSNITDTIGYVLEGFFPYVRMGFTCNAANVANGTNIVSNIYAR